MGHTLFPYLLVLLRPHFSCDDCSREMVAARAFFAFCVAGAALAKALLSFNLEYTDSLTRWDAR